MFDLAAAARALEPRVREVRGHSRDFEWYPYNSLSNIVHLAPLISGHSERLHGVAGEGVLDLGCGDGDLSFLFESMGHRVHAVDNPITHHNGMRGVYAMKEALRSNITVQALDADLQPERIVGEYGLAVFLGMLYHVKNPFGILETLAKISKLALVSTRVARHYPSGEPFAPNQPVAYLLGEDELNRDNSNYWIFSPPALERLFERSHWRVLASRFVGEANSDPVHRDERAFYLLESTFGMRHLEFGRGWHEPEGDGWRWTERRFSLNVHSAASIRIEGFIPDAVVAAGPVTLSCPGLPDEILDHAGDFSYLRKLPTDSGILEFELTRALPPLDTDPRERGIIVSRISI